MVFTISFVPGGVSQWFLSLQDMFWDPVYSRCLSNCCFDAVSLWAIPHAVSLSMGTQFVLILLPLPEVSLIIFFKMPGLSLTSCKNSQNLAPLVCKAKCYEHSSSPWRAPSREVCFSPLFMPMASLSPTVIWVHLVPNWVSTLPSQLDVASSLHIVVEFILPVFRSFSGCCCCCCCCFFALMWVLSSCILDTTRYPRWCR